MRAWVAACGTSTIVAVLLTGCASVGSKSYEWSHAGEPQEGPALRVLWTKRLTPELEGPFLPMERAQAALDPSHDRLYIGSTEGTLRALDSAGRQLWTYRMGAPVGAAPALDPKGGVLFAVAGDGSVDALRASDGKRLWRESAGDAIRKPPLLTRDAVYVVTDSDRVLAFARKDGALLWDYSRDIPEGFAIAGRAGLLLYQDQLITGFTDGSIVALDPTDGRVLWNRDTSLDTEEPAGAVPMYRDVDTTPVVLGNSLYAASFSGGLYAIDPDNGSVRWRDAKLTGIVGIAAAGDQLLLASADFGLMALAVPSRSVRWRRPVARGAPTTPVVRRGLVLVGASDGSFLALSAATGKEVGRLDSGHGFNAEPAVAAARGFILSNGGTLFAFAI